MASKLLFLLCIIVVAYCVPQDRVLQPLKGDENFLISAKVHLGTVFEMGSALVSLKYQKIKFHITTEMSDLPKGYIIYDAKSGLWTEYHNVTKECVYEEFKPYDLVHFLNDAIVNRTRYVGTRGGSQELYESDYSDDSSSMAFIYGMEVGGKFRATEFQIFNLLGYYTMAGEMTDLIYFPEHVDKSEFDHPECQDTRRIDENTQSILRPITTKRSLYKTVNE
jgi:hypothetical protein